MKGSRESRKPKEAQVQIRMSATPSRPTNRTPTFRASRIETAGRSEPSVANLVPSKVPATKCDIGAKHLPSTLLLSQGRENKRSELKWSGPGNRNAGHAAASAYKGESRHVGSTNRASVSLHEACDCAVAQGTNPGPYIHKRLCKTRLPWFCFEFTVNKSRCCHVAFIPRIVRSLVALCGRARKRKCASSCHFSTAEWRSCRSSLTLATDTCLRSIDHIVRHEAVR